MIQSSQGIPQIETFQREGGGGGGGDRVRRVQTRKKGCVCHPRSVCACSFLCSCTLHLLNASKHQTLLCGVFVAYSPGSLI